MGKEFVLDTGYDGYVYIGNAQGVFENERGQQYPFFNIFVVCPVSSYQSENYQASGLKADKKKCVSPEVWRDLEIGDRVRLFFDDRNRVIQAVLDN